MSESESNISYPPIHSDAGEEGCGFDSQSATQSGYKRLRTVRVLMTRWSQLRHHSVQCPHIVPVPLLLSARRVATLHMQCTVPDNCGTIFIPGDRWPKRATHILPPCLLEMTWRPAPNQINQPTAQQLEATLQSVSGLLSLNPQVCCLMLPSIHPFRPSFMSRADRCRKTIGENSVNRLP